jgi:hypothetical protein
MLPIAPTLAGSLFVPDTGRDASSSTCSAHGLHAVTLSFSVATLVTSQSCPAPLPAFGLGRLGRGFRRFLGCHCQRERAQKGLADKFILSRSSSLYDRSLVLRHSWGFLSDARYRFAWSLDNKRTNPRSAFSILPAFSTMHLELNSPRGSH